jgi:hypothetical protein
MGKFCIIPSSYIFEMIPVEPLIGNVMALASVENKDAS